MRRAPKVKVGWRRRVVVGVDREGNDKHGWSDPVDVLVYAVYRSNSVEGEHDRVVTDMEMLVPPGFACSPYDKFVYRGATYAVAGRDADWGDGPFGYAPGGQVSLKLVDG